MFLPCRTKEHRRDGALQRAQSRAALAHAVAAPTSASVAAAAHTLVAAATEAVARSHELLTQVRRGRQDSVEEVTSVLELLRAQQVGGGAVPPRGGPTATRGIG